VAPSPSPACKYVCFFEQRWLYFDVHILIHVLKNFLKRLDLLRGINFIGYQLMGFGSGPGQPILESHFVTV